MPLVRRAFPSENPPPFGQQLLDRSIRIPEHKTRYLYQPGKFTRGRKEGTTIETE
jgi:hypothetical protein